MNMIDDPVFTDLIKRCSDLIKHLHFEYLINDPIFILIKDMTYNDPDLKRSRIKIFEKLLKDSMVNDIKSNIDSKSNIYDQVQEWDEYKIHNFLYSSYKLNYLN